MKHTIALIVVAALFAPLQSLAQWTLGVQGGISIPARPAIRPVFNTSSEQAEATGNVFAEFSREFAALRIGIGYEYQQVNLGRYTKIDTGGTVIGRGYELQDLQWLMFPVRLKLQPEGLALRPYGLVGVNLRVLLSAHLSFDMLSYIDRSAFDNDVVFNSTAIDIAAGAGVQYSVARSLDTFLEASYVHGLTPLYSALTTDFSAVRALQISAGLMIGL